ncbi:MAG: DUF349 domain-containing protein [Bacteroidota bacterium]
MENMENNSIKLISDELDSVQEQSSTVIEDTAETTQSIVDYTTEEIELTDQLAQIEEPTDIANEELVDTKQVIAEIDDNDAAMLELEEKMSKMSKVELTEELGKLLESDDVNAIKKRVSMVRLAYTRIKSDENKLALADFISGGGEEIAFEPLFDEIDADFNATFNKYKQLKKDKDALLENDRQANLKIKMEILDEIKKLISSEETLKKTYDEFRLLQDKWSSTGPVPPKDLNNLLQNYHHHVELFFDFVKLNNEMKDLDMRKNLELKIELCEKAEELLIETSVNKSFQKLQDYHLRWKEIGPVPSDKKDDIWERFKTVSDQLNERRKDFYDKQQVEREENLVKKTALCEKVEQIIELAFESTKDFEDKAKEISEIQKEWKTIGFAPKKDNDEIWRRFKVANDKFFDLRTDFYKDIKSERTDNLNKKLELCINAESMQNTTDWKQGTTDFLRLQDEWKKIGAVPPKYSDKIWKRFRAACDAFFNAKSTHFSSVGDQQTINLNLKKELVDKVENFVFNDNSGDNLNILKDFQRQWMEIGHVPLKDKDRLYKQFKAAIDKHFENLKISNSEKQSYNYKSKIESYKDNSDGSKQMSQEKRFITNKMATLKSDIAIWENNIGFLSKSKSSETLRNQYLEKIEQAKKQIEELNSKMKLINSI